MTRSINKVEPASTRMEPMELLRQFAAMRPKSRQTHLILASIQLQQWGHCDDHLLQILAARLSTKQATKPK